MTNNWEGLLKLSYEYRQDSTQLIEGYSKAPLKIQRSFYPEGQEICHSTILHTAGGIVGGDRLNQNIHLQSNSHAVITTAAASKVYRSNGQQAQQKIEIDVEDNGYCEWIPRETIVFNGAIYRQDLRVNLAENATWLGWEITRFGRTARGEQFLTGNWRSCTEVWQNNQPLWIDRQWLPGGETIINSPHGLREKPIVGSLSWLGKPISKEMLKKVRGLSNPQDTEAETGVTLLLSGLLCRYRGNSTQEVIDWFTKVWQLLRQYNGKSVTGLPRVWKI
ncbi:MAG: urease accessory protein UreD [Microcoleaceae cyanobacterium]